MARFGLVGDLHGKVGWLRLAFEAFERVGGVDAVLQVGDFGIDWPRAHKDPFMLGGHAEHLARQYGAPVIFTPGNHDAWDSLLARQVEPEGYRKIRDNIWMLHGGIMTIQGVRIAGLGGATSSDKSTRLDYEEQHGEKMWWPEERVDRDLAARMIHQASGQTVDVLLTHEVSDGLVDDHRPPRRMTSESYQRQSKIDRLIIRDLFEGLQPRLHVTGHHHVRRTVRPDPAWYHREPRLEMMGRDGDLHGFAAIWDSDTGEVLDVVVTE